MKKYPSAILLFLIVAIQFGCKKEEDHPLILASLSTTAVSSVTSTSALSGGNITDAGGSTIIERGICYATTPQPTLADSKIPSGDGSGSFMASLTGLTANTTYYIRSYAINSVGTAYGNNEIIFNTSQALPLLNTIAATSITGYSAVCGGQITANESTVINKGICYGLSPNPTIADSVTFSLSPLDNFSVNLTNLLDNTSYYARAFVTTAVGTGYGAEISFTTLVQVLALGETYNGGIIFFIDETKAHGLIASLNDQSINSEWGCEGTDITGASGIGVGDGIQNTMDIINDCSSTTNGATICSNLDAEGFTDWVLPSIGELELMHQNLYLLNLGNFSTYNYWSSTEVDASNASRFSFKNNATGTAIKNSPYAVRAIRSF